MILRLMNPADHDEVARVVYESLNAWYMKYRGFKLVTGPWETMRIFPRVYEALDPNCCITAVDEETGRIAGACFFHPRPTHYALGIMAVHPDFFGRKAASLMLRYIIEEAERENKPIRLVSSSMNLESFSTYNRQGFVPRIFYQDMIFTVPQAGLDVPMPPGATIRAATEADVAAMTAMEMELSGIHREKDFRFFIENKDGIWSLNVLVLPGGKIAGFMASVDDPGSAMLGPGLAENEEQITALVLHELNRFRGRNPVVLVPAVCQNLTKLLYSYGATNCELHFSQIRAAGQDMPEQKGIAVPTFMPETG